ncbi:MAG: peptidylprolyl isomerase [Planctomycetota bacterium]
MTCPVPTPFRRAAAVCCAVLFGLTLLLQAGETRFAQAIIALVNGEPIHKEEIEELGVLLAQPALQERGQLTAEEEQAYLDRALQELVRSRLIHQAARREGVTMSDSQLDEYLSERGMENTPRQRRMVRDDVLFDRLMLKQRTPMSDPCPREVRTFYEEHKENVFTRERLVRARVITIPKVMPETRDSELRKIRRIRQEALKEGADFAAIAGEHCGSAVQRQQGGLVTIPGTETQEYLFPPSHPGLREHEVLAPAVLDALVSLDEGVVSEVLESDRGFHLTYIEKLVPARAKSFADAQEEIYRFLRTEKRVKLQRRWFVKQIRDSSITWHDGTPLEARRIMPEMPSYGDR